MLISFGLTVRIIHFVLGLVWQKFHFRFLKFSTLFTFNQTDVQNWTSAHGEDEERRGGAGAQQLFLLQLNLKTSSTQRSRFGQDWVDSCEIRRGGWRWEGGLFSAVMLSNVFTLQAWIPTFPWCRAGTLWTSCLWRWRWWQWVFVISTQEEPWMSSGGSWCEVTGRVRQPFKCICVAGPGVI